MKIHFWGVRGSIPTPVTAEQIQAKISAAIARMTPQDAADEDSKEKFLATLPPHIFGTVGGNSACVEVKADDGTEIVLDCGSGLRAMAKNGVAPADKHYNIFVSHFHWDHIQGLPFFDSSFNPSARIDFYSNYPAQEKLLEQQSSRPYFPKNGCWPSVKNQFHFHLLKEGEPVQIGNLKINTHKMKHPGNSYSISIEENGKKFIYATDVELQEIDFDRNRKSNEFFKDADKLNIKKPEIVSRATDNIDEFIKLVEQFKKLNIGLLLPIRYFLFLKNKHINKYLIRMSYHRNLSLIQQKKAFRLHF